VREVITYESECPPDVPEHAFLGLRRYALDKTPVGGFLTAVLKNDLREAVFRADAENLRQLEAIVRFVHWELPGNCWGDAAKVEAWLMSPMCPVCDWCGGSAIGEQCGSRLEGRLCEAAP
jgi:hypothetical protein